MHHVRSLALFVPLLSFATLLDAQPIPAGYADGAAVYFKKALETSRTNHKVPAVGGVLVLGGKIVAHGATGVRTQLNTNMKVTDNDRFSIGSVTKPFTSFVAAAVMQNFPGELTWNTRVDRWFKGGNVDNATVATLSDMSAPLSLSALSHASCGLNNFTGSGITCRTVNGVVETADKTKSSYFTLGRDEFAGKIVRLPLGTANAYNNNAPVLISAMLQQASGKTLEECAKQYVLAPIGSNAKFINEITNAEVSSIAFPILHEVTGINFVQPLTARGYGTDWARFHLGHASGGLMISPRDMGRWFIEMMPTSPDRKGVLTNANLTQYLSGSTAIDVRMRGGWFNVSLKDKIPSTNWLDDDAALWHNGSILGNYCEAFVFPNDNFAFSAVTNVSGDRGTAVVQELSRHCMALSYQRAVVPLFKGYNPSFKIEGDGFSMPSLNTILKDVDFLTSLFISGSKPALILSDLPKFMVGNQVSQKTETVAVALPRNTHGAKSVTLYKLVGAIPSQAKYEKVQTINVSASTDNVVFKFSPAYTGSKLKLEFEKSGANNVRISEIIVR
jgi:CubicO group peptidase (beta-lactamase class C family)